MFTYGTITGTTGDSFDVTVHHHLSIFRRHEVSKFPAFKMGNGIQKFLFPNFIDLYQGAIIGQQTTKVRADGEEEIDF